MLRYLKDPVMELNDLYRKHPLGGQPGWYAFVFNAHNFAYWHHGRNKWELVPAYFTVFDFMERMGIDPDEIKAGDGLFWDGEKRIFSLFGLRVVNSKPGRKSGDGLYLMHDADGNAGIYVISGGKEFTVFESFTDKTVSKTDAIRLLMEEKSFTQIAAFDPYSPGDAGLGAFVAGNIDESLHQAAGGQLRKIRVYLAEACAVRPIVVNVVSGTVAELGETVDLPAGFSEIAGDPIVFQRNFSTDVYDDCRLGLQSMSGVPLRVCESRSVRAGLYYEVSGIGNVGDVAIVSPPVNKRLCFSFFMST